VPAGAQSTDSLAHANHDIIINPPLAVAAQVNAVPVVGDLPEAVDGRAYADTALSTCGAGGATACQALTYVASDGLGDAAVTGSYGFSQTTGLTAPGAGFPAAIACATAASPTADTHSCVALNATPISVTTPGTYVPTVTVDDVANALTLSGTATATTGSDTRNLAVNGALEFSLNLDPPPPGVESRSYADTGSGFSALTFSPAGTGTGAGNYTWGQGGSLPGDVACAQSGDDLVCEGTGGAATLGNFTFDVNVSDGGNATTPAAGAAVTSDNLGHPDHTVNIGAALALTTTQAAFPNGLFLFTYNPAGPGVTLATTGGLGGNVWVAPAAVSAPCPVPGGALPPGLTLGAVSGLVSGVPTVPSPATTDYTFEVCVHDTTNATTPAGFAQPPVNPITAGNDYRVNIMGTWAFIAGPGGAGVGGVDTVEVIDTVNTLPVTSIALAVGDAPDSVAVTPDGRFAYVTLAGADAFEVIDTITLAPIAGSPFSFGGGNACTVPQGVAITPDGRAYIACSGNDRVQVIDTATNTVVDTINLTGGDAPDSVAVRPDGSRVYVTLNGANQLLIFDNTVTPPVIVPAGGGVVNPFPLPSGTSVSPRGIAVTTDGTLRAYIAKAIGGATGAGEVEVIDVSTDILAPLVPPIDLAPFAPPGSTPDSVALSPVESFGVNFRVWVTLPGSSGLFLIDNLGVVPITAFATAVALAPVGITIPPVDPLVAPTPVLVWVPGSGSDTVDAYVDVAGFAVFTVFGVTAGSAPTGIAHIPVPK
jgi:YVTN family beta-propeller protein